MADKKQQMKKFSITEFDKGLFMINGILNKKQLDALYEELIEPKSRKWRGQYQAFSKDFVSAYKEARPNQKKK